MGFSATACPISGAVYGVVLNDRQSLQKLGSAMDDAPYKGAPKAPAMYIKPANTLVASGAQVALPAGAERVEIGATVGIVIGAPAARLTLDNAALVIAGYVPVADLSLPHASYYRPAIREKCFDGACPVGTAVPLAGASLDDIVLTTYVDGQQVEQRSLGELVRKVPQLLVDVTEFMSLRTGDVLLVGVAYQAAQAAAGSSVRVDAGPLGSVAFTIANQPAGATA
jgi:5-oxopent-3-ene-1,2,5-tricarboxylate decarboxylase/2-hydroxyhepta-2,4-diene-1,7-dioate isomerase